MKEYVLRAKKLKDGSKSGYVEYVIPGETKVTQNIDEAITFEFKESAQDYCDNAAFCYFYFRPIIKKRIVK